jgi:hypothetical protein
MRGSDKHGSRQDEAMAKEVEGLVRGGKSTHAQEWKEAEPSAEGDPQADRAPNQDLMGATPEGMTAGDVEGRSQLASYLGRSPFPGDRQALIDAATEASAPAAVLDRLQQLPEGQQFTNVDEVWTTLGGGHEEQRF